MSRKKLILAAAAAANSDLIVFLSCDLVRKMDSLRTLFLERIQATRNNLQNTLGFQPLTDALDDVEPRYAIVFPAEVYENLEQRDIVQRYVSRIFADHGLDTVDMQYKDSETYEVDHCGSRFRTLNYNNILDFVVTVRLEPIRDGIARHIPKVPTWSILPIDYDDFRTDLNTLIRFNATESWAILDSEDKQTRIAERLAEVLLKLQRWLDTMD